MLINKMLKHIYDWFSVILKIIKSNLVFNIFNMIFNDKSKMKGGMINIIKILNFISLFFLIIINQIINYK